MMGGCEISRLGHVELGKDRHVGVAMQMANTLDTRENPMILRDTETKLIPNKALLSLARYMICGFPLRMTTASRTSSDVFRAARFGARNLSCDLRYIRVILLSTSLSHLV